MIDILNELASTNSIVDKQYILQQHKDNELLKRFFALSLDPRINFFQKKIPEYTNGITSTMTLEKAFDDLSVLSKRVKTGNEAKKYLADLLQSLDPSDAVVLERTVKKDPMCGVSHKIVNKIWKNLIPEFPCMLASKYDDKLVSKLDWKKGVYVQLKSDGMRVAVVCKEDGAVEVFSRNGKMLAVNGQFDKLSRNFKGFMIDGELIVKDKDGKTLDRKTGNGICNKAIHGTISEKECSQLHLMAWDIVPVNYFEKGRYEKEYYYRFAELVSRINESNESLITRIPTNIHHSMEDAVKDYRSYVARGEEGALLKDANMIWESKRSKGQIKMKEELDADLKIVDTKPHSKKEGWIGALMLESSDGLLKVDCGSGLTDELRQMDSSEFIGKIAAVKYNQLITDKRTGEYSLFLPILLEIREDKLTANTLCDLK